MTMTGTTTGTLDEHDGRYRLTFTRSLAHPPEKVWRALTEPAHLRAWFPSDIEGDRAAGAKLRFVFREGEAPTMDGEMLAYDPPRLLELRWDTDILRFELRPDGAGTLLTFVNTFPEQGKAARDAAGWDVCIDLLAADLDGVPPVWRQGERWRQVHAGYVAEFPAEAATIGPPEGHSFPE
jgi:uncharacterized protein YndB with AHSA1/START domain